MKMHFLFNCLPFEISVKLCSNSCQVLHYLTSSPCSFGQVCILLNPLENLNQRAIFYSLKTYVKMSQLLTFLWQCNIEYPCLITTPGAQVYNNSNIQSRHKLLMIYKTLNVSQHKDYPRLIFSFFAPLLNCLQTYEFAASGWTPVISVCLVFYLCFHFLIGIFQTSTSVQTS